jgi:hypothetical protein
MISLNFFNRYHLPFGMSDVDNYMFWLGGGPFNESDQIGLITHIVVLFFFGGILGLGYMFWLNVLIPVLVWLVLPLCVYWMFKSMGNDDSLAVCQTLLFMFGSFTLLFFQFTALWAELVSFILFVLALKFYTQLRYGEFMIFLVFSVLSHPFILGVWFLFFISWLWDNSHRGYAILVVTGLVGFVMLTRLSGYITLFTNYMRNEPTLYMMFFVYTCPLLLLFVLSGFEYGRFSTFMLILLVVCPFIQLGRGMPFLQLFLAYYGGLGFRRLRTILPRLFPVLCWILFYLWFDYFFGFMNNNMVKEFVLRGIN